MIESDLARTLVAAIEALAAGLRKRQPDDHEVTIAPRASHNLKRATLLDPHGFEGEIVPEAAAKLRSWLRVKLGPER